MEKESKTVMEDSRKGWTSASNSKYDALCAGRHIAQKGLPEFTSTDAETGTRIHAALAAGKPDGLSAEETDVFDACRKIESKLVEQYFGADAPEAKVFREKRFWAKFNNGQVIFEHSGQPDVVYRHKDRLLILDYKTSGKEVDESPTNFQLRDLAVLTTGAFVTISEVAVAAVQPLVTHSPTLTVYTPDDLKRAAQEMAARVIASNDPKSRRVAGQAQCAYCRAAKAGVCVEYQKFAGAMLPAMMTVLEVPVAQWTPEQRAVFCERKSVAQKWLDDVTDAIKEGLRTDPAFVAGWALKPGAVRETINNPRACWDRFAALGGTVVQFMGCVTVGKTKLKTAVNEVTGAKGQSLDKAMKALTDGITEEKQNAPSLVKKD